MWIRLSVRLVVPTLALAAVAACGSSEPEEPALPPAPSGDSTVSGVVRLEGATPELRVINMSSDPICMVEGPVPSEVVLVGPDGGLANVFLYVREGFGDQIFAAPQTEVLLDQEGCRYRPHVVGVQVGQPLRVRNSDPGLHNVHALPSVNQEFNFAQPLQGLENVRTFTQPEIAVPFRCEVHGWMSAFVGVVPHPFFAVSAPDGSFEIAGLPEGTYTVEAWHERFGTQTGTVTVDGTSGATLDFTFTPE